jgi:hypothetical protein
MSYQYFTIPIACVPATPPYPYVWFATWSSASSSFVWSKTRPTGNDAGTIPTYVCGVTTTTAPPDSTVIISLEKVIDPQAIPGPISISESDFRTALKQGLIQQLDGKKSL